MLSQIHVFNELHIVFNRTLNITSNFNIWIKLEFKIRKNVILKLITFLRKYNLIQTPKKPKLYSSLDTVISLLAGPLMHLPFISNLDP